MDYLLSRWKEFGALHRADMDWQTKMLFIKYAKRKGVCSLDTAKYVGLLEDFDGAEGKRSKRKRKFLPC